MVGKCCQKILILGGRFSENILPSGDFLSRLMGENVPSVKSWRNPVKYLQEFNFSEGMLRTGPARTRSSIRQDLGPGTLTQIAYLRLLTPQQLSTPVTNTEKMANNSHHPRSS